MKIRMKFSKQGPLKFIGHLDIMRYFQKVMRRAEVDIRYSEGFSPHQIMSFAAPLGVGILSNGEYVDIEVNSTEDSRTMIERINRENAEGFRVLSYRMLEDSAKNAMSMVAAADYTMWFKEGYEPDNVPFFMESLLNFCNSDKIEILKKTKKGEKLMDIRPYIYEVRLIDDETAIFMKVSSGSTANVKPEQIVGAYFESIGLKYPTFAFQVQREEVYADIGGNANQNKDPGEADSVSHNFVPLEKYGADIE